MVRRLSANRSETSSALICEYDILCGIATILGIPLKRVRRDDSPRASALQATRNGYRYSDWNDIFISVHLEINCLEFYVLNLIPGGTYRKIFVQLELCDPKNFTRARLRAAIKEAKSIRDRAPCP